MFGATDGDFCQGLIHPELMPPFRPGPRGWPDNPLPYDGLYLCGAACHGGPGVTFIPGYNAGYEVLEAADRDPNRVPPADRCGGDGPVTPSGDGR